ncbi:MAG: hypothetical protein M0018_01920 [Nitrospiraceae bacterium]|nr:hypothetical protein [Nitrospiraceae bacterium]
MSYGRCHGTPFYSTSVVDGGFIRWAGKRAGKVRCRIEKSFQCLPLENDEICLGCYQTVLEARDDGNGGAPEREDMKGESE